MSGRGGYETLKDAPDPLLSCNERRTMDQTSHSGLRSLPVVDQLCFDALERSHGECGFGHTSAEPGKDKSWSVQLPFGVGKQILERIESKETLTI